MVASGTTSRPGGRLSDGEPHTSAGTPGVGARVREVVAFANYYAAAQIDRLKLTAINIAMFAVLGLIALAIGLAIVFTAAVVLVIGVAGAIGAMLGGRMWAGELITSVAILGTIAGGVVIGFKLATKSTRGKLKASYDQRKRDQRDSFGTDVDEQSR